MLEDFREVLTDHTLGWGKVANGALKRQREEEEEAEKIKKELAEVKATNKRLRKRLNGVARLLEEGNESQNAGLEDGNATEEELGDGDRGGDEDTGTGRGAGI
jgi:hypothetical protein